MVAPHNAHPRASDQTNSSAQPGPVLTYVLSFSLHIAVATVRSAGERCKAKVT